MVGYVSDAAASCQIVIRQMSDSFYRQDASQMQQPVVRPANLTGLGGVEGSAAANASLVATQSASPTKSVRFPDPLASASASSEAGNLSSRHLVRFPDPPYLPLLSQSGNPTSRRLIDIIRFPSPHPTFKSVGEPDQSFINTHSFPDSSTPLLGFIFNFFLFHFHFPIFLLSYLTDSLTPLILPSCSLLDALS